MSEQLCLTIKETIASINIDVEKPYDKIITPGHEKLPQVPLESPFIGFINSKGDGRYGLELMASLWDLMG